ncbi:hypothetical protein EB077_08775 [bacterium]|nr:hypothetical protein [bacterium]
MSSKNNPEMRGRTTELRKFNGKEVKPTLYINGSNRYIAGCFETGEFACDSNGTPIPYKKI